MSLKITKKINILYDLMAVKQEQIISLEKEIQKQKKELYDIKKIVNILERT